MSTSSPPRAFPAAYFLHSDLASPKALQSLLAPSHLLKLRKAWLPGHSVGPNGSVVPSGCGFGDWEAQDEIQGVVLYVGSQEEEDTLSQHIGEAQVKDVDVEVCMGGIWGSKQWTVGRAFVSNGVEKSIRSGVSGHSTIVNEDETYTLRGALQVTGPPVENTAVDKAPLKTPKPKRMALLRRITEPLKSKANVLENNFEQTELATKNGNVSNDTKEVAKSTYSRPQRPSFLRRHTDSVTSNLSVTEDAHQHKESLSDSASDIMTAQKTAPPESTFMTESREQVAQCCGVVLNHSPTVPTIIIEETSEKASPSRSTRSTMLNPVQQEVDVEYETQHHDIQADSTRTSGTSTRKSSGAPLVQPTMVEATPESEDVSAVYMPPTPAQTGVETTEKQENDNGLAKRTSWKPWDMFHKLHLKPNRESEESSTQEKEATEEKAEEQKSPSGVRGLVAMYEMLKK